MLLLLWQSQLSFRVYSFRHLLSCYTNSWNIQNSLAVDTNHVDTIQRSIKISKTGLETLSGTLRGQTVCGYDTVRSCHLIYTFIFISTEHLPIVTAQRKWNSILRLLQLVAYTFINNYLLCCNNFSFMFRWTSYNKHNTLLIYSLEHVQRQKRNSVRNILKCSINPGFEARIKSVGTSEKKIGGRDTQWDKDVQIKAQVFWNSQFYAVLSVTPPHPNGATPPSGADHPHYRRSTIVLGLFRLYKTKNRPYVQNTSVCLSGCDAALGCLHKTSL